MTKRLGKKKKITKNEKSQYCLLLTEKSNQLKA
jgi:hypothetical protein